MPTLRVIGPGRAGAALDRRSAGVGWTARPRVRRGDACRRRRRRTSTCWSSPCPTSVIADVAAAVAPVGRRPSSRTSPARSASTCSRPIAAELPSIPLVALPNAELGAGRLAGGAWFAVAGDPLAGAAVVDDLGGRWFARGRRGSRRLPRGRRDRLEPPRRPARPGRAGGGAGAGVPFDAYLDLVRATVDNVAELGPAAALTGPARRGDDATLQRHLDALPEDEREAYEASCRLGSSARGLTRRVELRGCRRGCARDDRVVPRRARSRTRRRGRVSASCRRWATCTTGTSR